MKSLELFSSTIKSLEYYSYNIWGQKVGKPHILEFNFDKSKMSINGNIYTVMQNDEWAYKFRKRGKIIEAFDGISGLYEFLNECCDPDSAFNMSVHGVLESKLP
jgi:hypothetical protein